MVVAAVGDSGEPLVHNLPAGGDGKAQGQVLQVAARLFGLHFEHGRETGALFEGGGVHGGAGSIQVLHLQGQSVGGSLAGFPGGGGQGGVHGAVALILQDSIHDRSFYIRGGHFLEQASVGQGGEGGLLCGKRALHRLCHGKGFRHVATQHQGFHGGIAVTGCPAVGQVIRRVFRELAGGPSQNAGGRGGLAAEGIGAGKQPLGLGTQLPGFAKAVHPGERCRAGHGQAVQAEGFIGLGEEGTAGHAVGLREFLLVFQPAFGHPFIHFEAGLGCLGQEYAGHG